MCRKLPQRAHGAVKPVCWAKVPWLIVEGVQLNCLQGLRENTEGAPKLTQVRTVVSLEVMLEVRGSSVSPRTVCTGGQSFSSSAVHEKHQETGKESGTWASEPRKPQSLRWPSGWCQEPKLLTSSQSDFISGGLSSSRQLLMKTYKHTCICAIEVGNAQFRVYQLLLLDSFSERFPSPPQHSYCTVPLDERVHFSGMPGIADMKDKHTQVKIIGRVLMNNNNTINVRCQGM